MRYQEREFKVYFGMMTFHSCYTYSTLNVIQKCRKQDFYFNRKKKKKKPKIKITTVFLGISPWVQNFQDVTLTNEMFEKQDVDLKKFY